MLIVHDHKPATLVAASFLALGLFLGSASIGRAADVPASEAAAAAVSSATVSLVIDGIETTYATHARSVGAFLQERAIQPLAADYLSPAASEPLLDGMRVSFRAAVSFVVEVGGVRRVARSSAPTVEAVLVEQGIVLGPYDEVWPVPSARVAADQTIHVVRVKAWTSIARHPIAATVRQRPDASLARGSTRTLAAGSPGIREIVSRVVQRDRSDPVRTVLETRVVRAPRAKVIAYGTGAPTTFADFAANRLNAAVHFAGSALSMIATAYTAGCYGCSGITALGYHAGHGIVAVDPRVIPLGTRLYVPGYGSALAGDTGGGIHGRRIDLGFNSLADALRFGRREITVYVLHK